MWQEGILEIFFLQSLLFLHCNKLVHLFFPFFCLNSVFCLVSVLDLIQSNL